MKRVMITGAKQGIGSACASAYIDAYQQSGIKIATIDLQAPKVSHSDATTHLSLSCDVSDEQAVYDMASQVKTEFGGLDILVHCAGIIHNAPLLETSVNDFDKVIAINLRGSFLIGQAALKLMKPDIEKPPRVILMASDMAYYGRETFSPYVASKHAVLGLVRSWAKEFAPGILVNAICPGPIDTAMLGIENMSDEWRQKERAIPLNRFGRPEEIAQMALFLSGDASKFITGQGLGANGGSVMP